MSGSRGFGLVIAVVALLTALFSPACAQPRVPKPKLEVVPLDGAPASPKRETGPPRSSPAPAASGLVAGEPIVGFDGQRYQTAFYTPVSLAVKDDRFDLIIHFHGKHQTAVDALEQSGLPAALVSVDLGVGSQVYRGAYDGTGSLEKLIDLAEGWLHDSGRLPNARVGRIAISAWSAGYGAARVILARASEATRVDALLLVDGLFADWDPKRTKQRAVSMDGLAPTTSFATKATRGEKLFVATHTAITQAQYAGAPECVEALLEYFGMTKSAAPAGTRPFGGAAIYSADLADFHVRGYDGKTFTDHSEQHRAMGTLHYAELRKYWERPEKNGGRR